ncbi:MAG: FtsX-like permease family protein [Candidatus Hydrogenedentes bacterium]|nr:FtsX-like permease family protein [Candidatus Hydrogenedentota bacterium]
MVMRILHRKLLRTLLKTPGQSLAVVMVVLCGTACYICIASAYRNLLLTRDTYYAQHRFADFEIHLERAPVTATAKLSAITGVRRVRGRIVQDVKVDVPGERESRIGRLISMPDPREPVLNDICLRRGRYFSEGAQNEVILSERFAVKNGLELGGQVEVSVESRRYPLRIVGLALSPEYVYMIRNVQELVPSFERFGILWVPQAFAETALDMREACNNIVGVVDEIETLDGVLERAEEILEPYGVFAKTKRENQISNRFLSDEIKGLGVSARIIPAIFQGVAALILLVLLNRMVRTERTQIGLLKAYGYSNIQVAGHYLQFALILAVLGAVGAFGVGQWLAYGMIQMYVEVYQFPLLESRVYPDVISRSIGIAMVFAVLGALSAAIRAARIHPAESMRPEAPRYAHRVWLERFTRLWRRLSFTGKMICRNISRNAFRAGINAFGVMVSAAILIVGFFTMDALHYGLDMQFHQMQRQDLKISFQLEQGRQTYYDVLRFDHVRDAEPVLEYPFEIRNGWRKKDIIVTGLPRGADMQRLLDENGTRVDVGEDGLSIDEHLALTLGISVGDRVVLKPLMGRVTQESEVVVRRIYRQFLGVGAYMNIGALSHLLNEPFVMNAALLRTEPGREPDVNFALRDVAAVASIVSRERAYQAVLDTLAQSMRVMNVMLVLFAGVIAFAVIYNVTSVSLAERQRELASLRVMGLTVSEVGRIMYIENFVLGVLGLLAGFPSGFALCRLLIHAYDSDLYRLPFHISARTLGITTALTLAFIIAANLAVSVKVRRLDLVEVLKERE